LLKNYNPGNKYAALKIDNSLMVVNNKDLRPRSKTRPTSKTRPISDYVYKDKKYFEHRTKISTDRNRPPKINS